MCTEGKKEEMIKRDKRVFVVKNNSTRTNIYRNAMDSFDNTEEREYYTQNQNKECLDGQTQEGDTGLILILTHANGNSVNDLFIGDNARVERNGAIKYTMRRHLQGENDARAIRSIIDKMDLNIEEDFTDKTYVLVSDMLSLYEELKERINSLTNVCEHDEKIRFKSADYELHDLSQNDCQAMRVYAESVQIDRTEFQIDRERIVNSTSFRRMVDKAQIFSAEKGDYFRTRMTHTLEVNQIAKAIAYALGLNLDLTEAIALGHDLGHTPFGHQGERTLDNILCGKIKVGIVTPDELLKKRCYGGFKHNYQSAKVLTQLENKHVDFKGLNVSVQVVEGVLKHTRIKDDIRFEDFLNKEYMEKMPPNFRRKECPISTLEGQVVAIADEIAQRGHDVDDALTSGVMTVDEFIDLLSIGKCNELKTELEKEIRSVEESHRIIPNKWGMLVARADYNAEVVIKTLFRKYYENPRLLNTGRLHKIFIDTLTHTNTNVSNSAVCLNDCGIELANEEIEDMTQTEIPEEDILKQMEQNEEASASTGVIRYEKRRILIRNIVDCIAGMTDGYALQEYERMK